MAVQALRSRWVFGDYIVYASNPHLARRIYEAARARQNEQELFGVMELPDGTGNWVKIGTRRGKPTSSLQAWKQQHLSGG